MQEIMNIKDLPKECMFFGYGSLMYYSGINGRGLWHLYRSNKELIPVTVEGLKRTMSAEAVVNHFGDTARFYSVSINKKEKVFGTIFKVHSLFDLKALLYNEGARPMHKFGHYHLYDITKHVKLGKDNNLRVFTLVCEELKDDPKKYYPGYIARVYKSMPKKYRDEFTKTGGIHPDAIAKVNNYYMYG